MVVPITIYQIIQKFNDNILTFELMFDIMQEKNMSSKKWEMVLLDYNYKDLIIELIIKSNDSELLELIYRFVKKLIG